MNDCIRITRGVKQEGQHAGEVPSSVGGRWQAGEAGGTLGERSRWDVQLTFGELPFDNIIAHLPDINGPLHHGIADGHETEGVEVGPRPIPPPSVLFLIVGEFGIFRSYVRLGVGQDLVTVTFNVVGVCGSYESILCGEISDGPRDEAVVKLARKCRCSLFNDLDLSV